MKRLLAAAVFVALSGPAFALSDEAKSLVEQLRTKLKTEATAPAAQPSATQEKLDDAIPPAGAQVDDVGAPPTTGLDGLFKNPPKDVNMAGEKKIDKKGKKAKGKKAGKKAKGKKAGKAKKTDKGKKAPAKKADKKADKKPEKKETKK